MYFNEKGDTVLLSKADIRVLVFWLRHPVIGHIVAMAKVLFDAARLSA